MIILRQKTSPGRTVIFSIFIAILVGTVLLSLPISQKYTISLVDCFFTATSAICVTGVLTVPFSAFTMFGKIIIALLIQIGGIGLITLSLFVFALFSELGISTKIMAVQIFELESLKNIKQVLIFIILFTLAIELIGAVFIYFIIYQHYTFDQAIFHAFFHSISSFCSAGLSSFENSLIQFERNLPMLFITGTLILCGTLGFVMWYEVFRYIKNRINNKRITFSLTTKVILLTTTYLIISAGILLILLEGSSAFSGEHWWVTLSNILFNAISYRSTGFTTISIQSMKIATVFLILMYSFIGSSPGSTGSGIKVTTFALFLATIKSVITGKSSIELKGRKIPQDQIFKALATLSLSFCWIIVSTFLLLLLEKDKTFMPVFFETISTFTTIGITAETTLSLSTAGKLLIIANMFIGRLGTLTILLAFQRRPEKAEFQYPEERIMIS